jgi:hypothetical protein
LRIGAVRTRGVQGVPLADRVQLGTSSPPGTWFVIVDGFGPEVLDGHAEGAFGLTIKIFDDVCNQ